MTDKYDPMNVPEHQRNFLGYMEATEDRINQIESIIAKAKDYEELKQELLLYIDERREFLKLAERGMYWKHPVPTTL